MRSYAPAPAPAPAPLPYGLIGSSHNVDYVDDDIIDDEDFHLKCLKSNEGTNDDDDDDLMSLCSVPEQPMPPLNSNYNHNGVHVCLFCTRSFNYIETHIATCKRGRFKDYGEMIDKFREKIDDFFKTKDRIVALKVLIEEKKDYLKKSEKEKYLGILKNLGPI